MNTRWMKAIGAGLVLAGLLGFASGCGDDAETDTALAINPPSSDLIGLGATAVLTVYDPDAVVYAQNAQDSGATASSNLASQIFLPLEWSVSNPSLGRIMSSAGYSAVYESHTGGLGQNVVAVKDQIGRAGIAVINHRLPAEEAETPAE